MKHTLRNTVIILVVIAIAGTLIWFGSRKDPLAVDLVRVARGSVEATVTNTRAGTVKACRRAKLAPPTGGQVAQLAVKEGDLVDTDAILVELWNEDLQAQVKLAEAETAASRANVAEVCANSELAGREARRISQLRQQGLVSEDAADGAETNAKARRAACQASRNRVQVADARVEVAKAALDRTRLKAPFRGTVAEVNGEVGEFITPSPVGVPTLPAVDLIDTSCLYVSAPIDEVDAPAIHPGLNARITLDAFRDRHFAGTVSRVAPYALELEKQARTVEVEAIFVNDEDLATLLPGYSADLEVVLDVRDDVVRIPTDAVLEGRRVLVYVAESQTLEERTIQTGISNWNFSEVVSGLSPGEYIVSSVGREGVEAGARVKPTESIAVDPDRE